jgi:hypothetical protein
MPIYFASVRSRRQALLRVTNEWPLVAPSEFRRGQKARYALLEVVSCCAAAFPVASIRACDPARNGLVRHWLPFARSGNDRSGAHRNRCGRSSAGHPSTWLNGVALSSQQPVGRAARFCLAVVVIRSQPPARQARGDWLWLVRSTAQKDVR